MYIHPLNYLDARTKVVEQMYGHLKYRHLTLDQQLEVVEETHQLMRNYMLSKRKS
jgi:hypothetical protein